VGVFTALLKNHVDAEHIAQDGLSAFTYVANWHFIASGQSYIRQFVSTAPSPLRHMWSLAIEEQFYLVWPLLVVGLGFLIPRSTRRQRRRTAQFRRGLLALCIVLSTLSFVRMITLYRGASDVNRVYYGTDTRAFIILVGAALGALCAGVPTVIDERIRRRLIFAGRLGALALLAAFAWSTTSSAYLYRWAYGAVALVMVLVLAAAAQPDPNPLARILKARVLVGLGLISYGVYLWHWPIFLWVTPQTTGIDGVALFTLRCAITLAVSLASYFVVEQPIRQGRLPGSFLKNSGVVPMTLVTAVAVVLLIPAIAYPSVTTLPSSGPITPAAVAVSARYEQAPRCDVKTAPSRIDPEHGRRVQLVGNSISQEISGCLRTILGHRGVAFEHVNPNGFLMCSAIPHVQSELQNAATHPDSAVFFALVAADPSCGRSTNWYTPVQRLVSLWKASGVHAYLVPAVPPVNGSSQVSALSPGPAEEVTYYRSLAAQDPVHITVLDAGAFLRTSSTRYPWRMPCVPGEAGCSRGSVGVRWTDGFHYCTDPGFSAHRCPRVANQAGERRAAASVADGLLIWLRPRSGHA
jgi:peptidoglycan/LPS O-acetylase OafA/YrhL